MMFKCSQGSFDRSCPGRSACRQLHYGIYGVRSVGLWVGDNGSLSVIGYSQEGEFRWHSSRFSGAYSAAERLSRLSIRTVEFGDAGTYQCTDEETGDIIADMTLNVLGIFHDTPVLLFGMLEQAPYVVSNLTM